MHVVPVGDIHITNKTIDRSFAHSVRESPVEKKSRFIQCPYWLFPSPVFASPTKRHTEVKGRV